jgi:hypothetical protein
MIAQRGASYMDTVNMLASPAVYAGITIISNLITIALMAGLRSMINGKKTPIHG